MAKKCRACGGTIRREERSEFALVLVGEGSAKGGLVCARCAKSGALVVPLRGLTPAEVERAMRDRIITNYQKRIDHLKKTALVDAPTRSIAGHQALVQARIDAYEAVIAVVRGAVTT